MADLSELTKKFDLQGLVSSVKSMVGGTSIPEAAQDDPVGYRLAELSKMVKQLAEIHAQQAKAIAEINNMLNGLYTDLKAAQSGDAKPAAAKKEEKPAAKKEAKAPKEEKPAEKAENSEE